MCKQNTEPFELTILIIHNLVENKKLLYSSAKKFGSKSQKSVGEGFDSQISTSKYITIAYSKQIGPSLGIWDWENERSVSGSDGENAS